jgi:hypothetical protein
VRFATPGYLLKSLRDKERGHELRLRRVQEQHWDRPQHKLEVRHDPELDRSVKVLGRHVEQGRGTRAAAFAARVGIGIGIGIENENEGV